MMDPSEIVDILCKAFPDGHVEVRDSTGTGDHFEGMVVSAAFEGLPLVVQHQRVYAALGDLMHSRIHAFSFKTLTPAAWQQARPKIGG